MDKKEMVEVLLKTPITVEKDKAQAFFKALNYAVYCMQQADNEQK